VPLPLRPTPDVRARHADDDGTALGDAERNALAVIAEHVRERAGVQQTWIYAEPVADAAHAAIDEVARAGQTAGVPEAAARAMALAALRAAPRPLRRPELTAEDGMSVVAAETGRGRAVLVVAAAAGRAPLAPAAGDAIVELAEIAARVLADPPPAARPARAPARPPERATAYGAGLAGALGRLRRPPVGAESRIRLEHALSQRHPSIGAAVRAVETDIGLALAIVSAANERGERPRGGYASAAAALDALGAHGALRVVEALPELRALEAADRLGTALRRLTPHAIATRAAVELVARHAGAPARDELRLAAVLHDVGKLALATASDDYLDSIALTSAAPEERLAAERRRLGIDHAAIGAVAAGRLGLPKRLAAAIEHHHSTDATGPAALVRLADMIAHVAGGGAVSATSLAAAARTFGLAPGEVQRIAYDLLRARERDDAHAEPSPLSPMQERVLMGLAAAKTYKQIAADLEISESTVRSHLHNLYGKLEVADRAQAVLLATERGWI
jgi:putative nucleotidyltransferase with HDIG domain